MNPDIYNSQISKARTFGFREGSAFAAVMEKALSALKLKMPVTVITKSYWDGLSDKQKVSFFTEQGVRPDQASPEGIVDPYTGDVLQATNIAGKVAQQIDGMGDSNAGKYIGFRNHHLLVVNEAVGNELAQTIAALHELGHGRKRRGVRRLLQFSACLHDQKRFVHRGDLARQEIPTQLKLESVIGQRLAQHAFERR